LKSELRSTQSPRAATKGGHHDHVPGKRKGVRGAGKDILQRGKSPKNSS
jgi:hypothetical protein